MRRFVTARVGKMALHGLVETISPLVIKDVTQSGLLKFSNLYAAYKSKIEEMNKIRSENDKLKP